MRFFTLVSCLILFNFTNGQKIDKAYDVQLSYEDFTDATDLWPQRFTTSELLVVQDGLYKVQNKNKQNFTIISPKNPGPYKNVEFAVDIDIIADKKEEKSAGIACMIQDAGNSAIFIEISNTKKYRIRSFINNGTRLLSGNSSNGGWTKFSKLNNKGKNKVMIKCFQGIIDIYFNDFFVQSITSMYVDKGDIGLYLSAGCEAQFDNVTINGIGNIGPTNPAPIQPKITTPSTNESNERTESKNSQPKSTQPENTPTAGVSELVQIFKSTIEKQNAEINDLTTKLAKAENELSEQQEMSGEAQMYKAENERLRNKLNQAKVDQDQLKRKVADLERLQSEFIKNSQNGDLLLELSKLITKLTNENAELKQKVNELELKNYQNNKP